MYLDALIANSPFGIVTKDEDNRVLFCNRAFEEMFLYSQQELQGKYIDDLIASHDREDAARLTQAVLNGGVTHATTQRRRKDGTLIDVELHGIRILSGDMFVGAFAIYQDITERRRSEEKLQVLRNRLTRAQEEERSRIARDLHDDIGQRLALLTIDLEQLKLASMKVSAALAMEVETAGPNGQRDHHRCSPRVPPLASVAGGITGAGAGAAQFLPGFCGAQHDEDPVLQRAAHLPAAGRCVFVHVPRGSGSDSQRAEAQRLCAGLRGAG